MITIKKGNIFESKAEVLVNPVNCVGVMGKGLALEFKKRYPEMFQKYLKWCDDKTLYPGNPVLWHGEADILCFPTKWHWREKSDMFCIEQGLDTFIRFYKSMYVMDSNPICVIARTPFSSIAFPALGCGLGGLDWPTVAGIMVSKLVTLPIDVEIYEPE